MSKSTPSSNQRSYDRDIQSPNLSGAALYVNSLTKVYEGDETVEAVTDVDFAINEGEFFSIIGPSGSGKSTLLRMIAGFEDVTDGDIVLDGVDITDWAPFNRDTNMMFQDLALFPNYTVGGNIAYGLKQDSVPKEEREERVEDMLELVELDGYIDRDIEELSGGEQQRVALARCLVNNPKVVLFDEPLASLDRKLRRSMTSELTKIQKETGSTFLYVTHNQEVALSVSDRIVVLNDGEIEQVGTPEDLYDIPQTVFVANFVGDINTFNQTVTFQEDNISTRQNMSDNSIKYPSSKASNSKDVQDQSVTVGIRPDDLTLSEDSDDSGPFVIEGEIINRRYTGDANVFELDTENGSLFVKSDKKLKINQQVQASAHAEDLHIFDDEGERLA